MKYGRVVLIAPKKLEHAERWLARYEAGGVFFARLLPVIRHLISIPAGIVRMGFVKFSALTLVGAGGGVEGVGVEVRRELRWRGGRNREATA